MAIPTKTEIIDGVPITKTPIVPTTAALPVLFQTYGILILLLIVSAWGFTRNQTGLNLIPVAFIVIAWIFVTIYFCIVLIKVPENTGIILLDQSTGMKIPIGGPGQEGLRIKPKLFAFVQSDKDIINLQRRWIKDKIATATSTDKIPIKTVFSASYAWDRDRLLEVRGIDAAGADGSIEGALSSLIRSETSKLTLDDIQNTNKLQLTINDYDEVNPHFTPAPGTVKTSQIVQRYRKSVPVCDIQLDIEKAQGDADTRAAQEAVKQVEYTAEVALKAMFPKLPDKDSLAYKTLLIEAQEQWRVDHPEKVAGIPLPDDKKLLAKVKKNWLKGQEALAPDKRTVLPSDVELLAQAKKEWETAQFITPFPTGDNVDITLQAYMWVKLKSGEKDGMSYARAFEHAMNLAAQTVGINISGKGARGAYVDTNQGQGKRKR
jgi:hypothetical protein